MNTILGLCESGNNEGFKESYHAALGALALGALTYNAIAWVVRGRESARTHLAVNVILYSALLAMEARQCRHHMEARC